MRVRDSFYCYAPLVNIAQDITLLPLLIRKIYELPADAPTRTKEEIQVTP